MCRRWMPSNSARIAASARRDLVLRASVLNSTRWQPDALERVLQHQQLGLDVDPGVPGGPARARSSRSRVRGGPGAGRGSGCCRPARPWPGGSSRTPPPARPRSRPRSTRPAAELGARGRRPGQPAPDLRVARRRRGRPRGRGAAARAAPGRPRAGRRARSTSAGPTFHTGDACTPTRAAAIVAGSTRRPVVAGPRRPAVRCFAGGYEGHRARRALRVRRGDGRRGGADAADDAPGHAASAPSTSRASAASPPARRRCSAAWRSSPGRSSPALIFLPVDRPLGRACSPPPR